MSFLNISNTGKPLPVSKIPEYPQYGNSLQTVNKIVGLYFLETVPETIYKDINVEFPVGEIRIKQICSSTISADYPAPFTNSILWSSLVGNDPLGYVYMGGPTPPSSADIRYTYKTPKMISGSHSFWVTDLAGNPLTTDTELLVSVIIEFISASSAKDLVRNVST